MQDLTMRGVSWRGLLRGFFLVALLQLVACGGNVAPNAATAGTIAVATDATLQLLPARDMFVRRVVTQRIDAQYSTTSGTQPAAQSFIAQIEAGDNDMRMIGITPLGVEIFSLSLQGAQLQTDIAPYVSLPFDPRYVLADMQLATAPLAKLNAQLHGAVLTTNADASVRELRLTDGNVAIRIEYSGALFAASSRIEITHLQRHYRIHITTLANESL